MPHFTRAELLYTHKAASNAVVPARRYGVLVPTATIEANLEALRVDILERVADALGRGEISSAYRCPVVNSLVGGDPNSAHTVGLAADRVPPDFVKEIGWLSGAALPLDRVIFETRNGGKSRWLHLQRHALDRLPHATLWFFSPKGGVYTPSTPGDLAAKAAP